MSINHRKQPANSLLAPRRVIRISKSSVTNITNLLNYIIFVVLTLAGSQALPNVIDDIKADMLLNEATLLKAPARAGWSKKANIDMGTAARGDATPLWWAPDDQHYKSSTYWNAATPWFVMYPGEMHNATNVRVKISGIKLFILEHSTSNWRMINGDQTEPSWEFLQPFDSSSNSHKSTADKRIELDGKISYKLNSGLNPIHGGIPKFAINGSDVKAVYAQLTTELILDDPTKQDDRANAQILVSVGADYYPTTAHKVADFAAPHTWIPAIAASRFGLVKTLPRIHHMATIDPPGPIRNNGSDYPDKNKTISITEFEANPPPGLIADTWSHSTCN